MITNGTNRRDLIPILTGLLRAGDLVIIGLAALIAHFVRFKTFDLRDPHFQVVIVVLFLAANIFHLLRFYDASRLLNNDVQIGRLIPASGLILLTLLALAFFTKTTAEYSRLWIAYWAILAFVGLVVIRLGVRWTLADWRRSGRLTRRVAVYGAGKQGQRIIRYLTSGGDIGITIVGIYDERQTRVPKSINGTKMRGGLAELVKSVRAQEIDEVIVALPWDAEDRLLVILQKLKVVPVDVRLCPEGVAFQFPNRPFSDLHGLTVLNIYERPLSSWGLIVKAVEDRLLAMLILIFIAPSLLVIALLVKLDSPGPVFFRQKRHGFNNEEIRVFKFRSMYHDRPAEIDVPQATRDDPRVTRVGRILRRTSLDELPQFFNVLKGEMSIVGPRPHALIHNEKFAEIFNEYLARHNVKPGITGWAQVNGWRGETDTREKIERRLQFDLYYIEKWSLWFDLKIILLTPFAMLISKNSY